MPDELDERAWRQLHAADPASRRAALRYVVRMLRSFVVDGRDEARAVLLRALDDADAGVRCEAVHLLHWVGPAEELMPAIQAADLPTRRTAFQTLQREDLACSSMLSRAVLAGLRDPDPSVARR